ncbi:uncharacterized protein MONBRDRAFT_17006 [Monosiga brevicollis MX1]|uniref:Bystin n=1 Tax=Monosiga brevicollis TaxID=81824 RepID=BYST_MONBE|nr:uncharacterized protein MONBRDRAFT_17006 [Monosiga brevicollis MX1]A9UNU6.1 RecName: Full=Bystin [Monosiga brevicollis]EDQ92305.1 predicted protein [Monosiga brevicollis MX1]|eukprot:XP_001742067.1 hypothetical protein [Monosiga brevicollis MX1]
MSAKRNTKLRHAPLEHAYVDDKSVRRNKRSKQRGRMQDDESVDAPLNEKQAQVIARQAQLQQNEEDVSDSEQTGQPVDIDVPSDDEGQADDLAQPEDAYRHFEIDEHDEVALRAFMPAEPAQRRTLADIIMEKIQGKRTEVASQVSQTGPRELNPKVIEVYQGVGQVLSRYRSGKLPKAFKIIPRLKNWEEIVYITEPENWTAASMYAATRLFASNLKEKMAQRFYNLILLPRVRDDIAEYKRLNFHLYQAIKKAIFKPGAFFKGFLLPLCEAGDCTLREAVIIGGILVRKSIPVLHSSAAMLKMAEMPYSGATSIFLRVLLDKKYSLPFRVVDAVVAHFYRFNADHRQLPVLWHQCLLVFVQRYKEDITSEQKRALLDVLRSHNHYAITPEIRRELVQSKSRDREMPLEESSR